MRSSERGRGAEGPGVSWRSQPRRGSGGKQEVARRVASRAGHAPVLLAKEEDDRGGGGGGLGRSATVLGRLVGCTGEAR